MHVAVDSSVVTGYDGIVLAGPPASGRRTVAFTLTTLSRSYVRVPALTARTDHFGSSVDSELASSRHIHDLRVWAQIFHEFRRDGMTFVFDRERIVRIWEQGRIPVSSVDSTAGLRAFSGELGHWLTVLLWCPRGVAETRDVRLRRNPGNTPDNDAHSGARLRAWNRSARDLYRHRSQFVMSVRTDRIPSVAIAQMIHVAAQAPAYVPSPGAAKTETPTAGAGTADSRADEPDGTPADSIDQPGGSG